MNVQPGDSILYYSADKDEKWYFRLVANIIRIKTWGRASHIETYIGTGQSIGARPSGVRVYPLRTDDVVAHLRPTKPFNLQAALKWYYANADGQKYDFLGLFRFFTLGKQSTDRQFCSELVTRFYRAGGFEPFTAQIDADLVAPITFLYSNEFDSIKDF